MAASVDLGHCYGERMSVFKFRLEYKRIKEMERWIERIAEMINLFLENNQKHQLKTLSGREILFGLGDDKLLAEKIQGI